MAQLHELLAVEGDLKGVHDKILRETLKVFGRADLFLGHSKRLEMNDEDRKHEEAAGIEEKAMTTTVRTRLSYTSNSVAKYYDALLQKELTNQEATADLEINGEVIGKDLPATFLLGLEARLKILRSIYEAAPTLSAGIHWEKDKTLGPDVFRAKHSDVTNKTEKKIIPHILYEATKEHPAQVEKLTHDVVVGQFIKSQWSGMLSSSEKAQFLGNIDKLIQAVKRARMKANEQEVCHGMIGKKVFQFIHDKGQSQ